MIHASKICDPCGREFTPGEYLTAEQAALVVSCSRGCSSARARGYSDGPGRKENPTRGSDHVGGLDFDRLCRCEDCDKIRAADRSALIAETAARLGMGIVPPGTPRPPITPSDLGRLAAKIRKARLESYEPTPTDDELAFEANL